MEDVGKVGFVQMKATAALAVLQELVKEDRLSPETGMRDDSAYARFECDGRWGVVWTPGDRWFAVETDREYSTTHFEEGAQESDIREVLAEQVAIARSYVLGDYAESRSRFLKVPELIVSIRGQNITLTLQIGASFRRLFRGARSSRDV